MSKPMRLDEFTRLPARARAFTVDGLSGLVDLVAEGAPVEQRWRRYQWYAADLAVNRGAARTIIVEQDGEPAIALPFTGWWACTATLIGAAWPARGFPARFEAGEAAFDALLGEFVRQAAALAIGPAEPRDRAIAGLLDAARRRHWTIRRRDAEAAPAIGGPLRDEAARDPIVAAALEHAAPPVDLCHWQIVRPGLAGWIARLRGAQRTTSRV